MNKETYKNAVKMLLGKKMYNRMASAYFMQRHAGYREYAAQNKDLHNKYAGKRCFIIGNGPSLKQVDLSLLADEYTFTVNQLPRNKDFGKLKTNFHVWADARFFNLDLNRSEDRELFEVMKAVSTEESQPVVFYKWTAHDLIEKTALDKHLNIRYFSDIGMDIPKFLNPHKKLDICQPLPVFSTVVHYAICIAIYMGFREICLLGCDCTGFITTAQTKLKENDHVGYGYAISENEKQRMARMIDAMSMRNELAWYADLFDAYDWLNTYCQSKGVRLLNATETTLLESIPRVKLEMYLESDSEAQG